MIKLSPNHLGSLVGASWRSKKACKHVYYKQETEGKSFFNKPVLRISNYFSRFLIKCFTGIDGRLFLFVLLSPTGLCLLRQAPDPPPPIIPQLVRPDVPRSPLFTLRRTCVFLLKDARAVFCK